MLARPSAHEVERTGRVGRVRALPVIGSVAPHRNDTRCTVHLVESTAPGGVESSLRLRVMRRVRPDAKVGHPNETPRTSSLKSRFLLPHSKPVDHKLVIVARKDLKLGAGKLAAQVGHASVECALKAQRYAPSALRAWLDEGQKKVVVRAPQQEELFRLKDEAERAGLTTALIKDAGHTQLPPGTVTVLGIGPGPEDEVDRITRHLQLF